MLKTKYPPWTLLGGAKYVPAVATDIRATFARIRMQQKVIPHEPQRRHLG